MANVTIINPKGVKEGMKPLALIPERSFNGLADELGLTHAYLVEAEVMGFKMYAVYAKAQISEGLSPVQTSVPVQEKIVSNVSVPVSNPVIIEEIDKSEQLSSPVENIKEDKVYLWVKPTPDKIVSKIRCRCIAGSNSGREGIVVNVVRPGVPDFETQILGTQGQMVTGSSPDLPSDIQNNAQAVSTIMGQMALRPISSVPDKVSIEWDNPFDGTTKNQGKDVNAKVTGLTTTKRKFCDEFMIWSTK